MSKLTNPSAGLGSKYVDFFNRSKLFDKIIEDNRTNSYFVTLKKLLFLILDQVIHCG